jgi:hypothetical protein
MLVEPGEGIERFLAMVDKRMAAIEGTLPAPVVEGHMAVAQVHATCALVHAVRELAAEIRKARGGGSAG